MKAVPELTLTQVQRLQSYLGAPARPEGTMGYCELAGFLFAVACTSERIKPSEWLPLVLGGQDDPEEILKTVKRGVYARKFGGGQVDISNGDFVFSLTESYLIEDGRLTAPLKGVNLIGNGPEVMRRVSMLGSDYALSDGMWTCGKNGQSVPVGVGCPTIKLDAVTVGGTQTG